MQLEIVFLFARSGSLREKDGVKERKVKARPAGKWHLFYLMSVQKWSGALL